MQQDSSRRPYDPNPRYPAADPGVGRGWSAALAELPDSVRVLAVDGPWSLDWAGLVARLAALRPDLRAIDMRSGLASWEKIKDRTEAGALVDDPNFLALSQASLADFFDALPAPAPGPGLTVLYGPGAALADHDALWYADLPKRYAEAAVAQGTATNLGQSPSDGRATTRRLFYVDWPVLDRHRDEIAARIDRWLDLQDPEEPASLSGTALRATVGELARRPFRTRPTFNTTPWGGQWGREKLGFNPEAPNTALGYELIAPESGVLLGDARAQVEIPFQLLVALHPEPVLGRRVHEVFGTSFPIRFDYLDTVAGGNLSLHCHPQPAYMKEVFGWPYTQHETYYVMVGGEHNTVFLGLREDADLERFQAQAAAADQGGADFAVEQYVQTFPAAEHQLFLIPAGTPHGSGKGNVVLEVSATPYLYSLRFYDWLRKDEQGRPRSVHVGHAFRNLDTERTGDNVDRDLVQAPRPLREGDGWTEELIGELDEMFFVVHRLRLSPAATAPDDTDGRFHVINVVEGEGVRVETASGHTHQVQYAETLVIPAAVGAYTLTALGATDTRIVKAFVK